MSRLKRHETIVSKSAKHPFHSLTTQWHDVYQNINSNAKDKEAITWVFCILTMQDPSMSVWGHRRENSTHRGQILPGALSLLSKFSGGIRPLVHTSSNTFRRSATDEVSSIGSRQSLTR
ncbi:uncharacterized protein PHALS_13451 [Plasmopara halstedii]|uniref:Uncharacterized protein n=1 Tax=Plasmopara halstedii TaxID=4781 RepID=A0A0P1AQT7_PLAHL|nr:uncharacterized protein PHALS_13451 [Plasmopara halstedii]CEG43240.1 hypothetical protein PHALS_13451 [Plasmopara halstedii]|eukprot:XP_024579609.1 hypothetical protein PHALS_13451 [Plasmopara halstedii]